MAKKDNSEVRNNITVFGTETEFDGVLEFNSKLVITGKFNGRINAPEGDLEIARNAYCNVDTINANSVVICGNVSGDINASDRVEICTGSIVSGNIKTARIRIANNVEFLGEVSMLEENPDADLFTVASKEFKQAMWCGGVSAPGKPADHGADGSHAAAGHGWWILSGGLRRVPAFRAGKHHERVSAIKHPWCSPGG